MSRSVRLASLDYAPLVAAMVRRLDVRLVVIGSAQ